LFKEDLIELLGPRAWEQEAKVSIGEKTASAVLPSTEPETAPENAVAPEDAPASEAPNEAAEQGGEVDENAA
jgi:hypothetical protein